MKHINIMGKMTARDISKNLLQYLSMIIITMLAVTLFCGFISNALTLEKNLNNFYEESNLTDIICQFSVIGEEDRTFLESLDTGGTEYRIYTEGSVSRTAAKIFICAPDNRISLPLITEGERGVLIDKHVSERDNIGVGAQIEAEMPAPFGTVRLTVTGIMNFAEAAGTHAYNPLYVDYGVFFGSLYPALPLAAAEAMFRAGCNQALIKTDSPRAVRDAVNSRYADVADSRLVFVSDRDSMESVVTLNNEIKQSIRMTYVFPVIFLLVSVLVILTTVGPLILRERTNIGTLKSVGVSDGRILLHYSLFGAVLCFIGSAAGAVAGPLIIPKVLLIKYNLVYSLPAFSGAVFNLLLSGIAAFVVCALAALIGFVICLKTVKEKPAACMRPLPPKENLLLRRISGKAATGKPRGIPLKMAVRNIIVKPSRALMTVIGVTGCVALLVCSLGIGDSVNNSVDFELGGQFKYDINTTFTMNAPVDFVAAAGTLRAEGRIEYYETYKTFFMTAKGGNMKDVKVFALPHDPRLTEINPAGKVLMTKSVAEDLGVEEGAEITLSAAGKSYGITIGGIIENSFTKGIFVSDDGLFDETYHTYGMWIKAPDADAALVEHLNTINGTNGAYLMSKIRADINTAISSIESIKLTMMIFSTALSVVVLYNLSLLNIKERSRDIATMKVLGFSGGNIGRTLLYEIMILVAIGTGLGLLLGYPMTVLVMSINRIEVLTYIYHIKPVSYVLSALMSVVTALVINLLFSRPIRKINMIESLKSVE